MLFCPGDKIRVIHKERRNEISTDYTVVCADPAKPFIVVTNGMYRDTIDKLLIKQNRIRVIPLSKSEEKEAGNMPREAKITRDILLEKCRELGTGMDAIEKIASEYGLNKLSVKRYLYDYKIFQELGIEPKRSRRKHTEKKPKAKDMTHPSPEAESAHPEVEHGPDTKTDCGIGQKPIAKRTLRIKGYIGDFADYVIQDDLVLLGELKQVITKTNLKDYISELIQLADSISLEDAMQKGGVQA